MNHCCAIKGIKKINDFNVYRINDRSLMWLIFQI